MKLYNTMSMQKEEFVPTSFKNWYSIHCHD